MPGSILHTAGKFMIKPVYTNSMLNVVDEAGVEDLIEGKAIGQRLRRLRLKHSMGLVELGRRTGLSASFLSQIETGRVVPTLRNLARVSMVFGKELSYFFSEENVNAFRISQAKDRVRVPLGEKDSPFLISESLSSLIPDRTVVPCVLDFLPEAIGVLDPQTFKGLELVYVIRGQLIISTETGTKLLQASDSIWIDGSTKRQYECYGNTLAQALIVTFLKDS
jgi:transcriptional regulator with XRE-family HTH domain